MLRKAVKLKKGLATVFGVAFLVSGAAFLAFLRLPLPAKTKPTSIDSFLDLTEATGESRMLYNDPV